jgi:hypothetical protein
MTLTIGRASGLQLNEIATSGDSLSLSGFIVAASENEFKARRQQLLGLVDNDDEDVFPLTYTLDSTLDGYYRVSGVDVSPFTTIHNGTGQFRLNLRRVPGYRVPLLEVVHTAVQLEGTVGLHSPNGVAAYPQGAAVGTSSPNYVRATESGTVWISNYGGEETISFSCVVPAADHYDGAAAVETLIGGVWYPMVGQQSFDTSAGNWRLNNGAFRFTVNASGQMSYDVWNGSAWEAGSTSFRFQYNAVTLTAVTSARVLRNDPTTATIRMQFATSLTTVTTQMFTVDISLRRGLRHVDIVRTTGGANLDTFALQAITATASTSMLTNRYIRQTSNDGSGNRFVIGGSLAGTLDLVNGRYTYTIGSTPADQPMMIGVELDGSAAVIPSTADWMVEAHSMQVASQQRVQVR